MTDTGSPTEVMWTERKATARAWREKALAAFKALWEVLAQNDETQKAQRLFDLAPTSITDNPDFWRMREFTDFRMRHLSSWQEYKRLYEQPSPVEVDRAPTLTRGAAQMAVGWARHQEQEGPPIGMLAIGVGNGFIEEQILATNPRIKLTIVDLDTHAFDRISAAFPGRVSIANPYGFYDWPEGPFEVISMFEVLEHLPDDRTALVELHRRLAPGGTLLISTPVAEHSVYQFATAGVYSQNDWWGHLRSHGAASLWKLIRSVGLKGDLYAVDLGGTFFGVLHQAPPVFARPLPLKVPPETFFGITDADVWVDKALTVYDHIATHTEIVILCPRPAISHTIVYANENTLWLDEDRIA